MLTYCFFSLHEVFLDSFVYLFEVQSLEEVKKAIDQGANAIMVQDKEVGRGFEATTSQLEFGGMFRLELDT